MSKNDQNKLFPVKEAINEEDIIIDKINISDQVKKDVLHVIDTKGTNIKGYTFEKDGTGRIVSFKDVRFDAGYESLQKYIHPDAYRFLSFITHPSYISVLQFGQMFNGNEDKAHLRTLLALAALLASHMCFDFVRSVTDAQMVYDALDDEGKRIIETWK